MGGVWIIKRYSSAISLICLGHGRGLKTMDKVAGVLIACAGFITACVMVWAVRALDKIKMWEDKEMP